jgi:hypothetical protein
MNVPEIIVISLFSAGILTGAILYIVGYLLKRLKMGFKLWDVIREAGYPSLARFQFTVWTAIVIFCFTTICIMRFLAGSLAIPNNIPENLLALMGISAGVTAVSTGVSKSKYGEETKVYTKETWNKDVLNDPKKKFGTMILENGVPSITRFQMLAWTLLSVALYLAKFLAILSAFTIADANTLCLPDIESTLLVLMGISQTAYVGGKWVAPTKPQIMNASYENRKINEEDTPFVVVNGNNFGDNKGVVVLDNKVIAQDKITWDTAVVSFEAPKTALEGKHTVKLKIGAKETNEYKFNLQDDNKTEEDNK